MAGNCQYDGTLSGNILVSKKLAVEKQVFCKVQAKTKIFDDGLKSVDWLSKVNSTKSREDELRCFNYTTIEFYYPDDLPDFDMLLETFQKDILVDEEKKETKSLMTIVSLLLWTMSRAQQTNDFSTFLTAKQKFGYLCLYIFHIIYLSKLFGK